jgi:hypothetical protein
MREPAWSTLAGALALLAAPALSTSAHGADIIYGPPGGIYGPPGGAVYERSYESYELRRFSHPAPAYAAPPYYGPPPRYLLERYPVTPPPYPYAPRGYVYPGAAYAQPDPYPRGYIQVDRAPPVIVAPRRDVRAYPYVVPQEGVVVETVRPYRWRWGLAPDPLF